VPYCWVAMIEREAIVMLDDRQPSVGAQCELSVVRACERRDLFIHHCGILSVLYSNTRA